MDKSMTWDEFKAEIDRQLEELGADGTIEIWYIDFSFPDPELPPGVSIDEYQGMSVH